MENTRIESMITCPIDETKTKVVELKSISKKYDFFKNPPDYIRHSDFYALKDVSLNIYRGEVLGLVGRNGAGKTTLLNIIAGILKPTAGNISIAGKVLGLFNLCIGFQDELSGKENIFLNGAILGAARKEIETKLDSIIEFSEIGSFINMPLGSYSQGMRLRLGFSIIANLDFDILVIDEVLAVGDSLFQSKCYQRLMDFKRQGRTLVITSQDMGIVERLCDEVALLDHGRLVFKGNPIESINRYRALLNTEKFFVGPIRYSETMVENTKKWADNISDWGKKLGTKEAVIESVEFINRFGFRINRIRSRAPLKIKVNFKAKDKINKPHFGIAIFREDGVYCYGPNTEFDSISIRELKPGRGYFTLGYRYILLAPGKYKVSVAIWDKNEKLAFDYHNGFYNLNIIGKNGTYSQLLNVPYKIRKFGKSLDVPIKLYGVSNKEEKFLITNSPLKIVVRPNGNKKLRILREDGVCCQEIPFPRAGNGSFSVYFSKLPLLPGCYKIYLDEHNTCSFNMIFNKKDHGTIYLEHKWENLQL